MRPELERLLAARDLETAAREMASADAYITGELSGRADSATRALVHVGTALDALVRMMRRRETREHAPVLRQRRRRALRALLRAQDYDAIIDYLMSEGLPGGCASDLVFVWLTTLKGEVTPRRVVAECERGDWLLWLARRVGYGPAELEAAVLPSVLRALRIHAPEVLDDGHPEDAAKLRALPDDVSLAQATVAVDEVWGEQGAWAWSCSVAEWAEWSVDNDAARHARCADEVRAALPDLAERFDKAVTACG